VVIINTSAHRLHSPRRSYVEIADPEEAGAFLEAAYGTRLRLSSSDGAHHGPFLRYTRTDAGAVVIDEVQIAGDVKVSPDPLNRVLVLWATAGHVTGVCQGVGGQAGPGEITLVAQPDLPYEAHVQDVSLTSVSLDPALVTGAATGSSLAGDGPPLRFFAFQPVSPAAAQLWRDTVTLVKNGMFADESGVDPLVLGHASRLLAATTLATFPNTVSSAASSAHDDIADHPLLLRRAVDYIERNVTNDIALNDIAHAVHISPRAVQYMFRRHLDTTPLQYLRGLRLHGAHRELRAADRAQTTVTQVAAKWGFAHTGRFAVIYREAYGRSPHSTLRE
jgi:AraC-like DNA-binding protein